MKVGPLKTPKMHDLTDSFCVLTLRTNGRMTRRRLSNSESRVETAIPRVPAATPNSRCSAYPSGPPLLDRRREAPEMIESVSKPRGVDVATPGGAGFRQPVWRARDDSSHGILSGNFLMFRLPRMKTFLFLFQGVASRFHFTQNILRAPILRHKHTAEVIHLSWGHGIELGNTRSPPNPPAAVAHQVPWRPAAAT